jgi:hypothetical protein
MRTCDHVALVMRQAGDMGRGRWSWRATGAALVVAVLAGALGTAGTAGTASAKSTPKQAPKLVQIGHVTFWECPAKTTQMLVGVNALTLHPGTPLTINFTVRNVGTAACNYTAPYAGAAPGPTSATLQAGPCGSVGFKVVGAHGRNVWPGPLVVHCPALGFAQLAPNATVSGSGTWDQTRPNSTRRVAPGSYTLVVDRFRFPLRLASH